MRRVDDVGGQAGDVGPVGAGQRFLRHGDAHSVVNGQQAEILAMTDMLAKRGATP